MRVGFDVSALVRPFPPGIVRVVGELLGALERRRQIEVVRLAPEAGETLRAFRGRSLPRLVNELGLAGLHSSTSAFPWRAGGKRVQTIHELPWRHGCRENAGPSHRLWATLGPLAADRVVVPSQHVASDLARRLLPGRARIRVVPWGVGAPFQGAPPPNVVDEVVLERLRLSGDPIALCVGAVRAKKELASVLRGVAELRAMDRGVLQVVVTGPETPDLRRDLGLASQLGLGRFVLTVGSVSDDELASLLRLASVVPVLSSSEGFALPVLEALACGTPVLVPAASAQSEIAGEAGIVVDPCSESSVAEGLIRALAERERLRSALTERARAFTWDATADKVEALWKELVP